MAVLWSAPTDDPSKGWADISAGYKVDAPNIAGVLDSIMRQRMQQQQQVQNAIKQGGSAVSSAMTQQRNDQIAQTLLDQQSDNDPLAQQLNDSNLRPSDAWKAYTTLSTMQQQKAAAQPDTAMDDLKYQALWNQVHAGDNEPADQTVPMTVNGQQYNVPLSTYLTHVNNQGGKKTDPWENMMPVARGQYDSDTDTFTGDPNGPYVRLASPNHEKTTVVPWDQYQSKQPQAQTQPTAQPGTPSTTTSPTGQGPTQDAIAYLKQHPELASAFDAKYGQGSSATYLNP